MTAGPTDDKWTPSYTLVIGAWVLLFRLSLQFDKFQDSTYSFYLFFLSGILSPVVMAAVLAMFVKRIWLKRWRSLFSLIIAPFIIWAVYSGLETAGLNMDVIRFRMHHSSYIEQVAKIPATPGKPKYKEFDYSRISGGPIGDMTEYTLIYDDSDKAKKPEAIGPSEYVNIQTLGDHFYLRTHTW